jgi:outer membrane protein TolC
MARVYAWTIGAVTGLHALGVFALAQDAPISATVRPPSPPPTHRLSLEDAQRLSLANNTGLIVGRLGVQEKSIAVDAATRDYLPKLLGNFNYFHFNDNLGKVGAFRTGTLGILPPGTRTIAASVVNQDSTLTAITLAQPITKLIAVNAAVQKRLKDTHRVGL